MARKEIVRRRTAGVVPAASGPPVRAVVSRIVSKTSGILLRKCGADRRPALSSHDGARPRAADLLAKSPEQNLCGKICSHHGAKLDENRTSTLINSTIVQSIGSVCRLVVISPAVSHAVFGRRSPFNVARVPSAFAGRLR